MNSERCRFQELAKVAQQRNTCVLPTVVPLENVIILLLITHNNCFTCYFMYIQCMCFVAYFTRAAIVTTTIHYILIKHSQILLQNVYKTIATEHH